MSSRDPAARSASDSNLYANSPCYPELIAILVAGLLHVVTELALSEPAARNYNIIVSLLAVGYLVWRARRSQGALRAWGMRRDNFWPALRAQSLFGAAGALVLFAYGAAMVSPALPASFWLTLALYPVWGIAQQFALQNLIARNLTAVLPNPLAMACVASALFAVSHYPRIELVILTGLGGVFLTMIYRRRPNLWAAGIVHGILGSLAFYLVLQKDPGAAILRQFLVNFFGHGAG